MKGFKVAATALSAVLLLEGCVTQPLGPTVAVMPGDNKTTDAFEQDNAVCQQMASQAVSGQAQQANNQAVGETLLGTVLGAGLGAAVGGGRGAGVGAAAGTVVGTGVGANTSAYSQAGIQQRYNISYSQCMASKGDKVPAYAGGYPPPPPVAYYPPPPPPGYYPPPPPPPPGY